MKREREHLREEIWKITNDRELSRAKQDGAEATEREMSHGRVRSVEFVSKQYDEVFGLKESTMLLINELTTRDNAISIMCDKIAKAMEAFEAYNYQYNIENVRMPALFEKESIIRTGRSPLPQSMSCSWSGVPDVSLADIDTVH